MTNVFVFAGQSNMSAYSPTIVLGPTVPGYAQTAANEWTGSPAASVDSGVAYPYPTLAANPCLYVENTSGALSQAVDAWGSFDKQNPLPTIVVLTFANSTGGTFTLTYSGQTTAPIAWSGSAAILLGSIKSALEALSNAGPGSFDPANYSYSGGSGAFALTYFGPAGKSTSILTANASGLTGSSPTIAVSVQSTFGTATVPSAYGLELSFLAKYRAANPGVGIACIKQALGGSALRGDWLPSTVQLGIARGGSSTSITLASSDFGTSAAYVGLVIRVTSGTGLGSTGTISAFDATSKIATVAWSGTAPVAGSGYGIERLQFKILRLMMTQATARLNVSPGPGNWQWGGYVWEQGESGAHSTSTAADDSQYLSDATGLFSAVRGLTRADLPILVGRIGNNWGWETTPNSYLQAAGYPYAAINYSYNNTDGRTAAPTATQSGFLAGAVARRATQVALGGDTGNAWWSNDDYPIRPPYSLTSALTDLAAYHWAGPGNMAAGERAYAAYASLVAPTTPQRLRVRAGGRNLKIRSGGH